MFDTLFCIEWYWDVYWNWLAAWPYQKKSTSTEYIYLSVGLNYSFNYIISYKITVWNHSCIAFSFKVLLLVFQIVVQRRNENPHRAETKKHTHSLGQSITLNSPISASHLVFLLSQTFQILSIKDFSCGSSCRPYAHRVEWWLTTHAHTQSNQLCVRKWHAL